MDLLSQRIELQGFEKCYDPEGDGDCFYKAAAFQLGRNGSDLKNSIFDYLAQNQYDSLGQNRLDFVCSDDIQNQDVPSNWSAALTLLRNSWANEMVIRAMSECFQCTITIITTSGDTPDSYVKVIAPPQQHGTPRYGLYFGHTGNHYFALKAKISGESLISCCSLMYSLNEDKEKVKACVETLCRYLDNICKNPEEERYQNIKQSNKTFQERVAPIKGATEFLLACGFEYKVLPVEDSEEGFYVLPKETCSVCERLKMFKEVLVSIVDLRSKLDQCLKPPSPDFGDKTEVWLQPHAFSTLINLFLPMEYLIGEMFWWQGINEAKQSDPDQLWSREHMTGSCAEGLNIPRSLLHKSDNNLKGENFAVVSADLDLMPVEEAFVTITDEKIPIFDIVRRGNDPRYVFLRLTEKWKKLNGTFGDSVYLHQPFLLTPTTITKLFRTMLMPLEMLESFHEGIHGPARKFFIEEASIMSLDKTVVFEYPNDWPESAMDWLTRPRKSGWPSPELVQDIFYSGCHLAPVGRGKRACEPVDKDEYLSNPETVTFKQSQVVDKKTMDESEWRISFSLAENELGQSLSPVQRHIFVLLKIIKKAYLSDHDVISTYHLKNLFFWECENRDNDFWREDNSAECLLSVLDHLVECLKKRHLPHFIIPESNLLVHEDPVKLDEAAETVLEVRENIFQKTFSVLTRLQSTMFQSRESVCDFNELKVKNKLITKEKTNEAVMYSLCQLYKEVIADEQRKNKESAMKSQQITSIIDCTVSILEILDRFWSESLLSQTSLRISDLTIICSLWSKYEDVLAYEMKQLESIFDRLEITARSVINIAHLGYALQEGYVLIRELYPKIGSELGEVVMNLTKLSSTSLDEVRVIRCFEALISISNKHKVKVLACVRDVCFHLGNLAKLIFCENPLLRLRVHESLLARCYCKLWFAKNGKRRDHSMDRQSFTLFVREDIKSHAMDEEFINLSLTFFDAMIMGRDSCQVVPETTVMKQVKEIQQSIARETVKACKTFYLLANEILKDGGVCNDCIEILKIYLPTEN